MQKLSWLFLLWIALVVGAYIILKLTYVEPTPPNDDIYHPMSPLIIGVLIT